MQTCGIAVAIAIGVMILLVIVGGISSAIMLPALARAREAARRASCQNNLKQLGIVCMMFANERDDEMWPALSPERGKLMFEGGAIVPEYLQDTEVMVCPSNSEAPAITDVADPALVDDHSYYYLGYVVTNEAEGLAFLDAYEKAPDVAALVTGDIPAPGGLGSGGGNTFLRLKALTLDKNGDAYEKLDPSEVPVMFEDYESHVPAGGNVLYLNGRVEFIKYPGKFPMTREFMKTVRKAAGKPAGFAE